MTAERHWPALSRIMPVALVIAAATMGLSACGSGPIFGQEKRPPDEFTVFSRAPLSVPPSYGLRPPGAEGSASGQSSPEQIARQAVTSSSGQQVAPVAPDPTLSPGTSAFLVAAGATGADPSIRADLDRESALLNDQDVAFTERLMFWSNGPKPGQVVDAEAENRRIQESLAQGQPVNTGQTPMIQRRQRALFEGIF